MKKSLLVAAAALVALSASATIRPHASKARFAKEKKEVLTTPGAFKNHAAKLEAMNAFYSNTQQKASKVPFVKANRAPEDVNLIPCYSEWTYYYSSILGGFIPKIMHDKASFAVDGEKAYLAPFAELNYVVGVLDTEAENIYADYGAVVYKFDSQVIGKYQDSETNTEVNLVLEPCGVENYAPVRNAEAQSFYAYYFAEDNEFYIPSTTCLAVYEEDRSKTELFDEYFVARVLDLQPQEELNQYISKGTFTGKSYYGAANDVSGDCQIYLGNGIYCVKGADGAYEKAWIEYTIDEKDNTLATVMADQFVGKFNFYDDDTHTTTHPGIIGTVGLLQEDGQLTAYNKEGDYSSSYKITENENETTTIANTNNTCYGDYVYEAGGGGMYNCIDQSITILYEPIETGINTVKANAANSAAVYNLAGQKVGKDFKGLVIKDGKKYIQK